MEPVLARLRSEGMQLVGPLPADTAFLPQKLTGFDAVVAMYHDQGLPVLKYSGFERAVNLTLGPVSYTHLDVYKRQIQVSEAEVDAALAAQASTGTQFHLAHILVGLPEGATAEQIATGDKKIQGVKGLIDKGEIDFAAAAVRYSDSPNALEGGDLGWRSQDEIPVAFAKLLKDMTPGQVVGPLRGPSGFQLLKLVEVRDSSKACLLYTSRCV